MALPTIVKLAYTASASGGLTPAGLAALMGSVPLYSAPPPNSPSLPPTTSDAVFDVLFGANVQSDDFGVISGASVTRTITLSLQPFAGAPTAPSFVSLGAGNVAGVSTSNPPFPVAGGFPKSATSGWVGSVVSSSPQDSSSGLGAKQLTISYLDITGAPGTEVVPLDGKTPVDLTHLNKYVVTDVEISLLGAAGYGPFGQVNLWSGPVDPVTGLPTGTLVGYLPNSYFTNFSFQQLTSWEPSQVADPAQAFQLVPPDFNYPDQTVITAPPTAPPPPSKYLLNYPPPSSIASPGINEPSTVLAGPSVGLPLPQAILRVASTAGFPTAGTLALVSSKGLQQVSYTGVTATSFTGCSGGTGTLSFDETVVAPFVYPLAANFTVLNSYLTAVNGVGIVANPFQGLGLGAFAQALNMPMSRFPFPGAVSMAVKFF